MLTTVMEFWGEPAVEINTLQLLSYRKLKVQDCFFFPLVFFREVECWWRWVGGFYRGRFRVRAGVKSKCVIVTKLMRKSRGGQCADRTLGCMIHRRGLNMNPVDPFPSTSPAPEIPTVGLHDGTNTKVMANHLTSPLVWATPSIWS